MERKQRQQKQEVANPHASWGKDDSLSHLCDRTQGYCGIPTRARVPFSLVFPGVPAVNLNPAVVVPAAPVCPVFAVNSNRSADHPLGDNYFPCKCLRPQSLPILVPGQLPVLG